MRDDEGSERDKFEEGAIETVLISHLVSYRQKYT